MSKLIYLVALLLLCLNLVSCGNPTTLVVTKKGCYDYAKAQFKYTIGAKLDIKNEGTQTLGEQKASNQSWEYHSYVTKNKQFGVHVAMFKLDLTYTSKGRSQYLEKPVKIENWTANGCNVNATTYYGWM